MFVYLYVLGWTIAFSKIVLLLYLTTDNSFREVVRGLTISGNWKFSGGS